MCSSLRCPCAQCLLGSLYKISITKKLQFFCACRPALIIYVFLLIVVRNLEAELWLKDFECSILTLKVNRYILCDDEYRAYESLDDFSLYIQPDTKLWEYDATRRGLNRRIFCHQNQLINANILAIRICFADTCSKRVYCMHTANGWGPETVSAQVFHHILPPPCCLRLVVSIFD